MKICYVIPGAMSQGPLGAAEIQRRASVMQGWAFAGTEVVATDVQNGISSIESIYEVEPWHHEKFEANPEKLSSWGHQLVGPVLGPSVRKIEELGEVA